MLSSSFIFTTIKTDEEFLRLDALIDKVANATVGYIGKEIWVSEDGKKRNSVYFWETREALEEFAKHPTHLEAKRQYKKWYGGFNIVISEIQKSYGDGALDSLLPNNRKKS